MSHFAATMPEPKFRSTKKRGQQIHIIASSEYKYEARNFKLAPITGAGPQLVTAAASIQAAQAAESKSKSGFPLRFIWPVAVGLLIAGFAPEWQAMASQVGMWAMRLTFPFGMLALVSGVNVSPIVAVYAQLPLDGCILGFALARGRSLKSAILQLLVLHALCAGVLWLIGTSVA
jgi:hypothetical protein